MKLPQSLVGVVVETDGRPRGLALPSLDERSAAEAWRAALGPGPYYVSFADRQQTPDLARVQRLARLGDVWLDGHLDGAEAALDLLIAGAGRLVVWGDADLLESIADSAVVGWDGRSPFEDAVVAAKAHAVPILATHPVPRDREPGLYQAPTGPWTGRFDVRYIGTEPAGDGQAEGDSGADPSDVGDEASQDKRP